MQLRKVYNWQLKRRVAYVYPQSRPKKQWVIIFDLNKCIACQTCSLACKTTWTSGKGQEYMFWNNVETKPYGGYPVGWDLGILSKLKSQEWNGDKYVGRTLFEAAEKDEKILQHIAEDEEWAYPNIGEDEVSAGWSTREIGLQHFLTGYGCFTCQGYARTAPIRPAWLPVRSKAIYKRPEDGIVLDRPITLSRVQGMRSILSL